MAVANIIEPSSPSEFEIQAWLYSALQSAGFNVRGEVFAKTGENRRGFKNARFDLVIFRNGIPQMIIEVKDKPTANGKINYSGRQYKKYSAFGIPLAYARGMDEAKALYERLVGAGSTAVAVETVPDIEAERTPNGGYTRETLARLGVSWPPPKGWKKKLEAERATISNWSLTK